jgi:hypothetical protein
MLAATGTGLVAQNDQAALARVEKASMSQAEIERSWAIQRQLAAIESDKDGFIDALIASWVPYLDNKAYDPWDELRPIMREATAWRLYGASLVGDFKTMIDVVRGKQSAGKFINAWSEPAPKAWATPQEDLGETTSQLVFTPIPPCRMVDTRTPALARTGILAVGVSRAFDLTTAGYGEGQGGQVAGCTGLPGFSHFGWAVNITAVGYTGIGGLKVYPFGGVEPATSIINYVPDGWAIANNGHVTGCYGCGDDIRIVSFTSPTHVIVDVMGYYQQATGFAVGGAPARTTLAGTTETVEAGNFEFLTGGSCPAGTTLVAGGQTNSSLGTILTSDHYITGTAWYEWVKNTGATNQTVTIYSICLEVN